MTYQEEFITFMVRSGVLTFGDFTTKSGRKTPYFVNTGNYKTGAQAAKLGDYYAACIQEHMPDGITCLFGPAYKGIPLAVSAILLAALILTVITNIITQVVKKITWDKIPTNILAVVVAMAVTLVAFFAACQVMGWAVTWYMVAGAVALGLFVAYAAMFGFDKLREALEQITNWGKE